MLHEVLDQEAMLLEIESLLNLQGQLLIVEPPIHVAKSAFAKTLMIAEQTGFKLVERPKTFLSKTALLQRKSRQRADSSDGFA
jgi:hypothetical protein